MGDKKPQPVVGVIGLGALGADVVAGLDRRGLAPVACHDVDPAAAARRLPDLRIPFVSSAQAVADTCDVVLVVVYDEAQVTDVLFGPGGVAAAGRRPLHTVLMSTVTAEFVVATAGRLEPRGITLVDCGVNGAAGIARGGSAVASVGGPAEAFAAVRPVLDLLANPVVHTGGVGTGMSTKLIRNMIMYAGWYAGSLGCELARSAGIDPAKLIEIVDGAEQWGFGATYLARNARDRAAGVPGARDPHHVTQTAHKDLAAALTLGDGSVDVAVIRDRTDLRADRGGAGNATTGVRIE
jgi:3-hydroxyisobutyrate dehydrogenase-like beta-hydroxyacid dehydrogenase